MGLCLFPDDGETDGPDACFSYHGFASFRRRLASEEGVPLDNMQGFGGDTSWSEVASVLEPLLNHPDDHGRNLTSEECRRIPPHLEGVLSEWRPGPDLESEARDHIRQLRDLLLVLRVCVKKNVELCFM